MYLTIKVYLAYLLQATGYVRAPALGISHSIPTVRVYFPPCSKLRGFQLISNGSNSPIT